MPPPTMPMTPRNMGSWGAAVMLLPLPDCCGYQLLRHRCHFAAATTAAVAAATAAATTAAAATAAATTPAAATAAAATAAAATAAAATAAAATAAAATAAAATATAAAAAAASAIIAPPRMTLADPVLCGPELPSQQHDAVAGSPQESARSRGKRSTGLRGLARTCSQQGGIAGGGVGGRDGVKAGGGLRLEVEEQCGVLEPLRASQGAALGRSPAAQRTHPPLRRAQRSGGKGEATQGRVARSARR
jgi:hypothetical protein